MIEISIVYNNEKQIEKVRELDNDSLTFNFIDITTKKGKKDGWALKNFFGAIKDPFIMCYNNGVPIKGFWSEASDNVIDNLISYLNGEME